MSYQTIYSQSEIEKLLEQLKLDQTESDIYEGKADLHLDTEGDRAFFIRHVAALANNVESSYLILGVEDKTWNPKGLPSNSLLLDSDETQRRMNQILGTRLDPKLSIRYRTYSISGVMIGVVAVEGQGHAPYIVAIDAPQYGGSRTRGRDCYIYRGVIYIRHGSNSIAANRQSDILQIIDKAQQITINNDQPDEFLQANNYIDIESREFGRHQWSNRLVEVPFMELLPLNDDLVPAQSWVSCVTYPVGVGCEIDTIALKDKLKPDQRIGRDGMWYHRIPKCLTEALWKPRTTPLELKSSCTWLSDTEETEKILCLFRVKSSGHIEFVCTSPLLRHENGMRSFSLVGIIGCLWQITYLSKSIYRDANFYGEVATLLNLVGTKGTVLYDLANGWDSSRNRRSSTQQPTCEEMNIQIEKRFSLAEAKDNEIEDRIRDVARQLSAYYDQDPRSSFDCSTNEFPVKTFLEIIDRVW